MHFTSLPTLYQDFYLLHFFSYLITSTILTMIFRYLKQEHIDIFFYKDPIHHNSYHFLGVLIINMFNLCIVSCIFLIFATYIWEIWLNEVGLLIPFIGNNHHIFVYFFLSFIFIDILFYSSHYLFHRNKILFNKFHYIHHEFKETQPFVTFYGHPVEHLLVNLMPVFLTIILISPDTYFAKIFITLATVNGVLSHTNINLPSFHFHQNHHTYFVYNYGVLGMMDKLFNTYK